MDLTTPDTPDPVTAAVAADPKPLGLGLLLVGLLGLVAGVYFGYTAYTAGTPPADALEGAEPVGRMVSTGHVVAALTGLAVALVGLGVGATSLARVPADDPARRRTEARTLILTAGGLLGLVTMAAGAFYLAFTFGILTDWLDTKTPPKDAWKPVAALLTVLAGAGLAFLAAQPARAEERNNPFLRRLVYGGNLALATLLLLLALVVGNVVVGLKVPNKLDTTEGGFYSLSDATKTYLAELTKPVTLYTTVPEGGDRLDADIRTLLDAMREANPRLVSVVPLSITLNRKDVTELRNRFPQADLTSSLGVLVAVGEKGKEEAAAFVRDSDMVERGMGRGESPSFTGESKLVKELLFLTESKVRPAVYFVTGHGELDVTGGAAGPGGGRRAGRLKTTLEKVGAEVRPLAFELADPKVPDDAAVVVLADPTSKLPAEQVAALRAYLTKPRADGKAGKLIVLSGPRPTPAGTGVVDVGLDPLLAEFGIALGKEYLLTQPDEPYGYTDIVALPSRTALAAKNPVVLSQMRGGQAVLGMVLPNCRTVTAAPPPPGAAAGVTADVLYETEAGGITWLEPDPPANPGKTLLDMVRGDVTARRELIAVKRATNAPRPVAAAASEGGAGRVVVFGSGDGFADPTGREPAAARPDEVLAATVNWLRDRPAVANIAAKDYRTYTLDRKASDVALVWLPVGATLFGVLALGLGVWVFRRK